MTTRVHNGSTAAYDLGPCLGKGGFGVCYKALERGSSERVVAVKKISLAMVQQASKEPYLQYEIDIHGRLKHRNVAELFATFVYSESIYFVLEYCSKKSLADMIVHLTTLPVDLAAYYFTQLIGGLQYVHSCGILHRDLKLSNILVDAGDVVKITDFGLSCSVARSYLERHLACGTPNYLSPEVLLRQGHTAKSDIWSCGVVLYTLFGGVPPFQMDELPDIYRSIVTGSYAFTRYHADDHLKDLVARMLQLDPEERPSLDEVAEHQFCRYSDQYESRLIGESSKADPVGCVRLRQAAGARLLSKSFTCVLGQGRRAKREVSDGDGGGAANSAMASPVSRSTTVVDLKLARISALLDHFRSTAAWTKLTTEFGRSCWLTWWRDKTATTCGFYYQLSGGCNCVLYNDATSCLKNTSTGRIYFVNHSAATADKMPAAPQELQQPLVGRFYEPLARDLAEEFQDVPESNVMREQVSWISSQGGASPEASPHYLCSWSEHCAGTYHVFHLSDESIQVNFADSFMLRVCGGLCYFYQPARKGFVVETKPLDVWCFEEVNSELVDVLCDIFLA